MLCSARSYPRPLLSHQRYPLLHPLPSVLEIRPFDCAPHSYIYRHRLKSVPPALRTGHPSLGEAEQRLQDCLGPKDWATFKDSKTDLNERARVVTDFVSCVVVCVPTKVFPKRSLGWTKSCTVFGGPEHEHSSLAMQIHISRPNYDVDETIKKAKKGLPF